MCGPPPCPQAARASCSTALCWGCTTSWSGCAGISPTSSHLPAGEVQHQLAPAPGKGAVGGLQNPAGMSLVEGAVLADHLRGFPPHPHRGLLRGRGSVRRGDALLHPPDLVQRQHRRHRPPGHPVRHPVGMGRGKPAAISTSPGHASPPFTRYWACGSSPLRTPSTAWPSSTAPPSATLSPPWGPMYPPSPTPRRAPGRRAACSRSPSSPPGRRSRCPGCRTSRRP